jgi:hypothetical protein
VKDALFDYSDICYETSTVKMEMEGMSDDALLDECNHILAGGFEDEAMDDILKYYFNTGKITPEHRKKAEAFYMLAYCELAWED